MQGMETGVGVNKQHRDSQRADEPAVFRVKYLQADNCRRLILVQIRRERQGIDILLRNAVEGKGISLAADSCSSWVMIPEPIWKASG